MIDSHLRVEFHVTARAIDPKDLDAQTDRVMEELLALETSGGAAGIHSSAVSANLTQGVVEVELCSVGETPADALTTALASIRAAIHAAGGGTPGYEELYTQTGLRLTSGDLVEA
jgi:hypothetical protein